MSGWEPRDVRRLSRLFLLSLPLLVFAFDFLLLLVSYLLLSLITPNFLGEVAARPALFAASIALAKLPITYVYMLAVSRHAWTAMVTRGTPDTAAKWRRRRVAAWRSMRRPRWWSRIGPTIRSPAAWSMARPTAEQFDVDPAHLKRIKLLISAPAEEHRW